MRTALLMASILVQIGCREPNDCSDGREVVSDMSGNMKDMTPLPACTAAAAQGLSGTPLPKTCIDFTKNPDLSKFEPEWNFKYLAGGCTNGWVVSQNNKLQPSSDPTGDCGFSMPKFLPAEYQQYKSLTFSIVHNVNIKPGEQATISLNSANGTRVWDMTSTNQAGVRQTTTIKLDTQDLPVAYQPIFLFQLPGGGSAPATHWQIESIVLMGNM